MPHDSSNCPTCSEKLSDSMSDAEFFHFLDGCRREMAAKQESFTRENPTGTPYHFDVNQGTFQLGSKIVGATAIGSYCPSRGTWLWAWANDTFSPGALNRSARLRDLLYALTGFEVFRDEGAHASSQDAEDFMAMALHVAGGFAFWRYRGNDYDLYLCLEESSGP